jgi:alkylhydroperoxidase/carboxymuconolactone decarboxylase family protein YurZ
MPTTCGPFSGALGVCYEKEVVMDMRTRELIAIGAAVTANCAT